MSITLEQQTMADKITMENPQDYFAQLRAEDPVHYDAGLNGWMITTYADLLKVSTMKEEFSLELGFSAATRPDWMDDIDNFMRREGYGPNLPRNNLGVDDPEHARRRGLVTKGFAAVTVNKLEPRITKLISDRIAAFLPAGRADMVKELATPLPLLTICDYIGLPLDRIEEISEGSDSSLALVGMGATKENALEHARRVMKLQTFVAEKIAERRENPGDDLLSHLIHAEIDDPLKPRLDETELLSIALISVSGGSDTVRSSTSWAIYALATRPEILEWLQHAPDQDKEITKFIDEVLRFYAPISTIPRGTTTEVDLGGRVIPKGANVFFCWGSGNHDAAHFKNPEIFDMDRPSNGTHLSFGKGPHFCLGAVLARLEMRCAIREFINRIDKLKLSFPDEKLDMTGSMVMLRGPRALSVEFTLKDT